MLNTRQRHRGLDQGAHREVVGVIDVDDVADHHAGGKARTDTRRHHSIAGLYVAQSFEVLDDGGVFVVVTAPSNDAAGT